MAQMQILKNVKVIFVSPYILVPKRHNGKYVKFSFYFDREIERTERGEKKVLYSFLTGRKICLFILSKKKGRQSNLVGILSGELSFEWQCLSFFERNHMLTI